MYRIKKILSVILCALIIILPLSIAGYAQEPLNYVVLGDSISLGSGLMNKDKACYGRIIADTNGYVYKNYGVNGLESSGLLSQIKQADVTQSIKEADIISISIGGNNFRHANILSLLFGGIIAGDEAAFDAVLDPFYDDFCRIISYIRAYNPDAVILVQTLYNPMTGILKNVVSGMIDRLNSCFRQYDKENPDTIVIADIAEALNGNSPCFEVIHPSAMGNVEIAKYMLGLLCELGLGTATEPVVNSKGINTWEYYVACLFNPMKTGII